MKVIIINDLNSKWDSVIPYGLRLARAMEAEAEVLHIIDTRLHQGEYTSYSDSQSITPGTTLSQDEIIKRETGRGQLQMDNVLSREASRLNYPLKVNSEIKVNSVEDELLDRISNNAKTVVVINSEPDGYIFQTSEDIIDAIKNTRAIGILVPPKHEFKDYKYVLLPTDFDSKKYDSFTDVKFIFEQFEPLVDATSVATNNNYADLELKGKSWKKVAEGNFVPSPLKTNVLNGDSFTGTQLSYMKRNNKDLVMLIEQTQATGMYKTDEIFKITDEAKIPVLLHYHKKE